MSPTTDYSHLVTQAQRVAAQSLAPRAARHDAEASFPSDNMADLHSAGLTAILVPKELGGVGAPMSVYVQVVAVLAQACGSTALVYAMHCGATQVVSASRSPRAQEVISRVVRDGAVIAWAFSEPGVGGNVMAPQARTRATSTAEIHVNGTKSFCTGAGYADFYLINTSSGEEALERSQTLVVLDADHPGLEVDRTWDGMGMRANQANTVRVDLSVDAADALGGHGGGLPCLATGLPALVLGLSATSLGIARAAYDYALEHVSQRAHTDTGHPLSGYQAVRVRVGESAAALHSARLAVAEGARMADSGSPEAIESSSLAKLIANTAALQVADTAMDMCGGSGYLRAHPLERYYRDARAGAVMGTSVAALKDMVGKVALGADVREASR